MKKIYLKEGLLEEILEANKATVDDDMILEAVNGKRYQLILAIKFLEEIADNDDNTDEKDDNLVGKIISKDELIENNYELFDNEVITTDKLYKVEVGHLGTLIF